jgi:hypothetical protein
MADTLKKLASGTLGTGNATLYTAGAATKAIVKSIALCNKTATAATATIKFDGINIVAAHSIAGNDTLILPMTQIVEATKLIEGLAGTGSAIDYYISGIEVT